MILYCIEKTVIHITKGKFPIVWEMNRAGASFEMFLPLRFCGGQGIMRAKEMDNAADQSLPETNLYQEGQ